MKASSEKIESVIALSPTQAGMLYHTVSSPGSAVYIGQHRLMLRNVDAGALLAAWQLLVQRHNALRTIYVWEGLSNSVQLILREHLFAIEELDFSNKDEESLEIFCTQERLKEFDLDQCPASRLQLLKIDAERSLLLWTRHHLLVDGWSAHTVLRELQDAYRCISNNKPWTPDVAPGFDAYIAWLQQQSVTEAKAYWQSLANKFEDTVAGLDNIRQLKTEASGSQRIECEIDESLTASLSVLAQANSVTLSTLVHAAWSGIMSKYNSNKRVAFGSTCSGRPASLADANRVVGNFIQTVPVSVSVDAAGSLQNFLSQLQLQVLSSAGHAYLPHSEILAATGFNAGDTAFESIVVFMNYPQADVLDSDEDGQLLVLHHSYDEHSHYPLAFLVVPDEQLKLILIYERSVIADGLAKEILAGTRQMLTDLAAVLEEDRAAVLSARDFFNQSAGQTTLEEVSPLNLPARSVTDLFLLSVAHHPESIAASDGKQAITYAELHTAARNFSSELATLYGIGPADCVMLMMPRSIKGIVSIWATLLLGARYVPISLGSPREKIAELQTLCSAKIIVCDRDIENVRTHFLSDIDTVERDEAVYPAIHRPAENEIAYTIFTSGSTGAPKPVSVSHANLAHSVAARLQFYEKPPGVMAMMSPFAFDSSVAGIFWASSCASNLLLVEESLMQSPSELSQFLIDQRCTTLLTLPSVYAALLEAWPSVGNPACEDTLTTAIVAGEACPTSLLFKHRARFESAVFVNEYGPTEATVWCSAKRFSADTEVSTLEPFLPIGKAIAGVRLSVCDAQRHRLPSGVRGELMVEGPTVVKSFGDSSTACPESEISCVYATGDLAELDQQGDLIFRGRIDEQLKIRGHRIEPAEIEAAIHTVASVSESVVTLVPNTKLPERQTVIDVLGELPIDQAHRLLDWAEQYHA